MKIRFKIKIHPLSYLVVLIFFLMGYFKQYLIFMIIILIHELGHITTAIMYKWKIEEVIILPFGGITKFQELINKPIYQEFIIAIMGIVFQLLFCYNLSKQYNFLIILFNLLPIYPLDGSKILNIVFNKISNFKLSFLITIYISFILIIILIISIIIKKDIILLIIIIPLIINIYKEYKNRYIIINKFYLERYLYKFKFKKKKIINNINKMKRDYIHIIKNNNKYIMEEEFLKNMFDK